MSQQLSKPSILSINDTFAVDSPQKIVNTSPTVYAKGDSGASDNYIREEDKHCLSDVIEAISPPVSLPDKTPLHGTEKGVLPFQPGLTHQACSAKVLPGLKSSSLISVGKLCDDGCKVLFDKQHMHVIKNKKPN